MTKPQWADAVSEWVSPDAWMLNELFTIRSRRLDRWTARSRDQSCMWVVDVWNRPAPFVTSVRLQDQSYELQCKGERVEPMADVFRRLKAAHSVARAQ